MSQALKPWMTQLIEDFPSAIRLAFSRNLSVANYPLDVAFSVHIYGAFEVLASGTVALVDVPGFGDANKQGSIAV